MAGFPGAAQVVPWAPWKSRRAKDLEEPTQIKPNWPIFVVHGAPRTLLVAAEGEQVLRKGH